MTSAKGDYATQQPGDETAPSGQQQSSGLHFKAADTLYEIVAAWKLVYKAYRRAGLIDSNPHQIHTLCHAIDPDAAVVTGAIGPVLACTLSALPDRCQGLPLDSVCREQLGDYRKQGCRLMELGLFADRREQLSRSTVALLELIRFACQCALHIGATDVVVGVHPHHVAFYTRLLGFDIEGPEWHLPPGQRSPRCTASP